MSVEALVQTVSSARGDILAALHDAAAKTGSDFDYLLGTAMRESGLDSQAKSKASSATGLFQFIDQTWLGLVKRYGEKHGMAGFANAIRTDANGHYTVASRETKQAILALRKDPQTSALMAGETAHETKQDLECALGRQVCGGELYAAHFLGETCAKRLIALNEGSPNASAAAEFPDAARANRSIFYRADGTPKSVREVYNWTTDLPDMPAAATQIASRSVAQPDASMVGFAMPMGASHTDRADAPKFSDTPAQAANTYLSSFASRAFSNMTGTQTNSTTLPSRPLLLSPGVIEVLASMVPMGFVLAKR